MIFSSNKTDIRPVLFHFSSHKRGLNTVKGAQQSQSKIIYTDPYGRSFLYFDPSVSVMKVITLRDFESFNIKHINRFYHGMY